MFGPILKEALVLIVFCHIFVSGKDLLEIFQPSPSLPQELNEWLASVQKHKNDFRLIREVAAKNSKNSFRIEEEDEGGDRRNSIRMQLEDDTDPRMDEAEEAPKNDIYPYMYKEDRKYAPKKSSRRLRRSSENAGFDEDKKFVNLEPKSKFGEIERVDEKYPERYKESFSEEQNKMKSNFKEKKEAQDHDKDISKREVQIEIKKNGKLVKEITEDESNPKSIILNIQEKGEKSHVVVPNQQFSEGNFNIPGNPYPQPTPSTSPPERSITTNLKQMKDKEFYSNFNNLFSVNEHLNTDSSLARQTASAMGPLVYHVTIPNFVSYPDVSPTYNPREYQSPIAYGTNKNFPIPLLLPNTNADDTNPPQPIYNYNNNNFQDMSKYWTASEKNQMEKGIQFARNNDNIKKFLQHIKMPLKMQGQSENETGFEPAQRIEVDNGKLVKINVEERQDDNKSGNTLRYIKRNNVPIQKVTGEGIIEIDGQKPTIVLAKQVGNVDNPMIKSTDAKPLIKEGVNSIVSIQKMTNLEVAKPRLESPSGYLKVNDDGNKNTIPNIKDFKPENKRQLAYIHGKIQPMINQNNLEYSWKPALFTGVDKPNSIVEISNNPPFQNRPVEKSTGNVLGLIESFKDTIFQAKIDGSKCDSHIPEDTNNEENQEVNQEVNYENPTEETDKPEDETTEDVINKDDNDDEEEEVPKCMGANTNAVHNSKSGTYSRKTRMRNNGFAAIPESEFDAPVLDINDVPQDRLLRLNNVRELSKINPFPDLNGKFREEVREQNVPHNNFRRNLGKGIGRVYQKYDPNLKKIVLIYNNLPYMPVKDFKKSVRFNHQAVEEPNEDAIDQDWDKNEDMVGYKRHQVVRRLPPNVMIKKRGNEENEIVMRKRYRKRQHGGYLGRLVANSDNSDSSSRPKLVGRRLQNVEYVYDNYEKLGDDYYDLSTEVQELASESEGRVELLQKDSVEGDYGDEEDSVTDKQKKAEFNIAKKTDNEFANPRTTTETEDDYYNDDYDNCREKPDEGTSVTEETVTEKSSHRDADANRPMVVNDDGISSVHHGRTGSNKFKTKLTKKHTRLIPVKANKIKIEDKEVGFTRKSPRKTSRHRRNRNKKHSGKVMADKVSVDKMSEFQHWPTFVIDDQETEEKLRKRSPPLGKYPNVNDFPLASKDFFVKGKSKRKINDGKGKRSTRRPLLLNNPEIEAPLLMEKRETPRVNPLRITRASNDIQPATEESCSAKQMTVSNACEMGENFNQSNVEVATILAIDSSHDGNENDTSRGIFEKIDDILDGYFPSKVVNDIFEEIKMNTRLQRRFNKGLRRSNKNLCFQNLNDTNTEETRKILDSMTCLMNRLQLTATCQVLPHNLRNYLKSITRTRKQDSLAHMRQMKEVNFDDNQNQKNFIFESSPQGGNNFQDKAKILKELLDKFNSLPERCQTRGQPVKEYIENHLGMLNNMLEGSETPAASASASAAGASGAGGPTCPVKQVQSRSDNNRNDALIQEQLASLGLGRDHRFIPQFDLDKMIENGRREKASSPELQGKGQPRGNANVNKRDLNSVSRSIKYNKLVDAVRKVKLKRDGERRLAEAFGRSSDYSGFSFNSRDSKDVAKASFESPLVYSL